MFAGPNGSGKSTIKDYLAPNQIGAYLNADELEKQLLATQQLCLSARPKRTHTSPYKVKPRGFVLNLEDRVLYSLTTATAPAVAAPEGAHPVRGGAVVTDTRVTTVTHDNEGNIAMATGIVTWFNSDKGYGFIAPEDGSADVFAHFSAIVGTGRRDLEENQRVEFDVEQGPKGLQATNIRGI
jgi:CspA family cold shock protein